ncbi:MAG TPA: hypothetical protein PK867_15975, partial [Pirellulales bacterium]|nr:hypothetical protein [Pirellulales bacterium]
MQGAVNFIATANAVLERAKAAVPDAQQKVADAEALVARREMEKKSLADAAQAPPKPLRAVVFSPDSSRLVVAGEGTGLRFYDAGDQTVKLWGFENPTPLRTMRGDAYRIGPYKREVTTIAFIA